MRESLTYEHPSKNNGGAAVFPGEIENLCTALGLTCKRVYDPDRIFIYPNIILKYSKKHKGWVIDK